MLSTSCVLIALISIVHVVALAGELPERLEIEELEGGFAGFTGSYLTIEKDGAWKEGEVLPRGKRGEAIRKGKLSEKELLSLAKQLDEINLSELEDHGPVTTNPFEVRVKWGDHKSTWRMATKKELDRKKKGDKTTTEGRYRLLLQAADNATEK